MPPINWIHEIGNTTVNATNSTAFGNEVLHVVCAWPVSGQYGPGSRVLYYILIAACVFARKAEWLRDACLAAALLFPAVAALHGIVLAAVHVDGAVDMDIYGAFQLCSIGILAAPVTVRLSKTYFETPGRNTIFLWTGLIFAGLLSLTVEFFRAKTTPCTQDDNGNPISSKVSDFPWNNITCGLVCTVDQGPFSPLRGGSTNNIYVIPAPDSNKLTFDTVTLLAAGCCIPAILSLISMWNKILEINWKSRFRPDDEQNTIEGTKATIGKMNEVNGMVRVLLSAVEVPVFGAAVLAILIMGERNFFSEQVRYQTEPIASIGQWAPIVGTGLAVLGSLYLLLSVEATKAQGDTIASKQFDGSTHRTSTPDETISLHSTVPPNPAPFASPAITRPVSIARPSTPRITRSISITSRRSNLSRRDSSENGVERVITIPDVAKHRKKVASVLTTIGNYVGTAAKTRFDDSEFKRGRALDFPEIPGEMQRNPDLRQIREMYNPARDASGNATRAPSIIGSEGALERERERGSMILEGEISKSPESATSPTFSHHENALGGHVVTRTRRDTLEVPSPGHYSLQRNDEGG